MMKGFLTVIVIVICALIINAKTNNIKDERIVNYLIDVSDYHNDLHDGFDMIDSKGNFNTCCAVFCCHL